MASDIGDREPQAALPDRADSTLGAKSAGVEALAERVGDLDASIILTGVQVCGEYDVALAGLGGNDDSGIPEADAIGIAHFHGPSNGTSHRMP